MSIQGLPGGITIRLDLDLASCAESREAQEGDTRSASTGPPDSTSMGEHSDNDGLGYGCCVPTTGHSTRSD